MNARVSALIAALPCAALFVGRPTDSAVITRTTHRLGLPNDGKGGASQTTDCICGRADGLKRNGLRPET
jgi:hypothetical protein